MSMLPQITRTNTLLYCGRWSESVDFYKTRLGFPVTFQSDWMVEFNVAGYSHLSIVDASRTTVQSSSGNGITLSFQVEDLEKALHVLTKAGCNPTAISAHVMKALVFYVYDPEGHRIEFWCPQK